MKTKSRRRTDTLADDAIRTAWTLGHSGKLKWFENDLDEDLEADDLLCEDVDKDGYDFDEFLGRVERANYSRWDCYVVADDGQFERVGSACTIVGCAGTLDEAKRIVEQRVVEAIGHSPLPRVLQKFVQQELF